MKDFVPGEWCYDPYAKRCERCDTIIGRFATMLDEQGLRHVLWWPHRAWDGIEGSYRCRAHTEPVEEWVRLF